jgi:uncharacterized membrane protein YfcA
MGSSTLGQPIFLSNFGIWLLGIFTIYTVVVTWHVANKIKQIHTWKTEENYPFERCDFDFGNQQKFTKLLVTMFIAGMLGSICGIAGGTILAPLFLSFGLMPVVSSATNQFLALMSTISVSY